MPPKKGRATKAKGKAAPKAKAEAEAEPAENGAPETTTTEAAPETAAAEAAPEAPAADIAPDTAPTGDAPAAEGAPKDVPVAEDAPPAEDATMEDAPKADEAPADEAPAAEDEPATAPESAPEPAAKPGEDAQAGAQAEEVPKAAGKKAAGKKAAGKKAATKASKKRKATDAPAEPQKASRRSARGESKAQPSHHQLLNYLLSDAAAELCRPDDENEDIKTRGADLRTYSSSELSPFEELLCAIVLSRPISHRLGLRVIRTILNDPYSFTTPKAIKDIGKEKRKQALDDAKTQHKDKTAEQIGMAADVVAEKFGKNDTDTDMSKLRDEAGEDWDEMRDLLQTNIKGLGKTGLDIFFRRVQWLWPEAFPFVDERTARGIDKLGLPKKPEDLVKILEQHWAKLDTSNLLQDDKETKKRRAFVLLCERATGADLEGKSDQVLEAAATS